MADITNPEAIRFINEVARPTAEKMRAMKAEIDSALVSWNAGIGSIIGTSAADKILDGREAEGVSRATAGDVAALGGQLIVYQTAMNVPGVAEIISKLCVRSLQVQ